MTAYEPLAAPHSEVASSTTQQVARILSWNALYGASLADQAAYAHALMTPLQDEVPPVALVIQECTKPLKHYLQENYDHVYFHAGITIKGIQQGICMVSQQPAEVSWFKDWPSVTTKSLQDSREYMRAVVPIDGIGHTALYGIHLTHPHWWWKLSLYKRRAVEAAAVYQRLSQETGPFIGIGDMNTARDHAVSRLFDLSSLGAHVVPNYTEKSWGFGSADSPRLFSVDKAFVSQELAGNVTVQTVPKIVRGVKNPSDHRAIELSIVTS